MYESGGSSGRGPHSLHGLRQRLLDTSSLKDGQGDARAFRSVGCHASKNVRSIEQWFRREGPRNNLQAGEVLPRVHQKPRRHLAPHGTPPGTYKQLD